MSFSDLQNEVLLQLEGFSADQAVMCTLISGVGSSDTTISVSGAGFSDGSGMSPGVWEIDNELVFVPDFNRSTGVASNVVRGWRGSVAAAHSPGVVVRNNPRFPLLQVQRAINSAVRNLFPRVPAVKTSTLALQSGTVRYQLPADCKAILSVSSGSDEQWSELSTWRFIARPGGSLATFTAIDLPYYTTQPVHVVYAAEPSPMSNPSDDFETVTGLPAFAREAVAWGAMWRLYSMVELGRGSFSSADQTMMNRQSDFGKATDIAKYLLGMHQQAVAEAEARMQDLYPARKHYVW